MPEQEQAELKACYAAARAIVEYGSGGSTLLAASLGKPCIAVESDLHWAEALQARLHEVAAPDVPAFVHPVDLGPTVEWGFPADNSAAERFSDYPLSVWHQPIAAEADTVLIDGRFRKACFVATLMHITRPVTILFDDYTDRPVYHEVEAILAPTRFCGRLAIFDAVPGLITPAVFGQVIPWFAQQK